MTRPDLTGIPEALATRPIDERRGLPVPYVNMMSTNDWDFTVINGVRSAEVGTKGRCGLCNEPLIGHAAFLGGPPRAEGDGLYVYTDPPMHEACAVAATQLCPHLRLQHAKRRKTMREDLHVVTGEGWRDTKPGDWVLTVWRGYAMTLQDDVLCYLPGAVPLTPGSEQLRHTEPLRVRVFIYDDEGVLREASQAASAFLPECPECGAPPGQAHAPTCETENP